MSTVTEPGQFDLVPQIKHFLSEQLEQNIVCIAIFWRTSEGISNFCDATLWSLKPMNTTLAKET